MKVVIDIPELDYECAKQRWMMGNDTHEMDYYISEGVPLELDPDYDKLMTINQQLAFENEELREKIEKIKTEIDDEWTNTHHMYFEYASGLARASEAIDKHIGKAEMRGKSRCNTCKNNDDDECSGECYECIKGIFDHYEPEEDKPQESEDE